MPATTPRPAGAFARTRTEDCYQCGKCTAGCPVAELMEVMPNQVIRLVQVGELEQAARCGSVWTCVACQTCTDRCPKGVDVAGVMDALRRLSVARGVAPPAARRTVLFQQAFLRNVRRYGRLDEAQLIVRWKARGFLADGSVPALLKDAGLGPRLARRRKLHPRGERVRDRGVVERIFERCEREG